MAGAGFSLWIRQAAHRLGSATDAELIECYLSAADAEAEAFAEIVRRYSRLIWGQCRNLLANEADADDAFQATFLALARSARSIRTQDRLGPWLHGVAYRICMNSRRAAKRRKKHEQIVAIPEQIVPIADSTWDRAAAALHEEVNKLPETLRVPFVLCCLEGMAPTDAAAHLGLRWGTFSSRLSRAKQRLIDALTAHGLPASLVIAAGGIGTAASSALAQKAMSMAIPGVAVPASLLSLSSGVTGMSYLKTNLSIALAVIVCGFGGATLLVPGQPGETQPVARAAPVPVPVPDIVANRKQLEDLWKELGWWSQRPRALLKLSAWPEKELLVFLSEKIQPLKLTQERAKKLIADLASETIEVAEAAREEMRYLDPRLALTVEEMLKDVPEGLHRQRIFAVLTYSNLNAYLGCKLTYLSSESLKLRNATIKVDNGDPKSLGGYATSMADTLATMDNYKWISCANGILVLEHLGTPGAVKLLESMATGNREAAPTQAAIDALANIKDKTNKYVVSKRTADELWTSLDQDRSVLQLASMPEKELLRFLGEKLKPMKLSKERAEKLLADLGDEKLAVAEFGVHGGRDFQRFARRDPATTNRCATHG